MPARRWGSELLRPVTPLSGRAPRSWALDASLAFLIALLSTTQPNPPQLALAVVVAVLLLFRRVWPVTNLLVLLLGAAMTGGHNLGLTVGGGMVAVHTLAVLCSLRVAVAGLLIAETWIVALGLVAEETTSSNRFLILVTFSAPLVLALVLGLYRQTRDRYQAELLLRNRHLEVEREQRDRLAAADERSRIAREMHDLIAHHLTVVVALSEGLARSGEITSPRSREAVTTTVSMARQALDETRRLLGAMPREESPGDRLPVPGLRSLDGLVSQVRATGLPVTYEVEGTPPDEKVASSGLQLTVYRLVQEALTNIMKHARDVSRTVVSVRYRPDIIEIMIEDDGQPAAGAATDGLGRGILGMGERVQSFGGTLAAGPGPAGGWHVRAGFPIESKEAAAQ